jgi:hypothetical protein
MGKVFCVHAFSEHEALVARWTEKISPIIVTLRETMIDGAQLSAMLFAEANEHHQQVVRELLYHYYFKLQQQQMKLRSVSSIGVVFPLFYLLEDLIIFTLFYLPAQVSTRRKEDCHLHIASTYALVVLLV